MGGRGGRPVTLARNVRHQSEADGAQRWRCGPSREGAPVVCFAERLPSVFPITQKPVDTQNRARKSKELVFLSNNVPRACNRNIYCLDFSGGAVVRPFSRRNF